MSTAAEPTTRRAEREREILDAAAKLFREQGYASTTIRDIGAEAQLNHASSHYYFGSKAAILYAIYQEALDGFLGRFESIADGLPEVMLADIVRAGVIEAARRPDYTAVFFQERLWLEMHLSSDRCRAVRERQARFRSRVGEIVQAGIDAGRFRPMDPMMTVETIVGLATWAYQAGPDTIDEAADQCAALVLGGVLSNREEA